MYSNVYDNQIKRLGWFTDIDFKLIWYYLLSLKYKKSIITFKRENIILLTELLVTQIINDNYKNKFERNINLEMSRRLAQQLWPLSILEPILIFFCNCLLHGSFIICVILSFYRR